MSHLQRGSSGGNNRSLATTYDHSSDKGIASKQPVCRSNVVSGLRMPWIPSEQAFPVNVGHALVFVFVWHRRPPWPGLGSASRWSLVQAAAVIGRGFAHSERRPQLKHTYCSMISPVNRSMAVSTRRVPWHFPHRVVCSLCIPQGYANRLGSPIGETASAHGFDTGFIPMSIVFPNSEISPGGLHSRSDLDEALELGLALTIVLTSLTRMTSQTSGSQSGPRGTPIFQSNTKVFRMMSM